MVVEVAVYELIRGHKGKEGRECDCWMEVRDNGKFWKCIQPYGQCWPFTPVLRQPIWHKAEPYLNCILSSKKAHSTVPVANIRQP